MTRATFVIVAFGFLAATNSLRSVTLAADATPAQVFEQRILPIFKSDQPSSCVQCHLAGVDLRNYIKPSSDATFLSLRDQGLVDLKQPDRSKILTLINMRDTDNPGANLLHAKVREAEATAFAEWLKACCRDPKLRDAPALAKSELAKPSRPDEVIRFARTDRLLDSFEQNIWGQRHRCMGCHSEGSEQNRKLVKENGEQVAWMKRTAAETMTYLIRTRNLIDLENPGQSLLLLKPLKEVEHGGGKKFLKGDLGYKQFRTWLEDYAKVARDEYSTAAELPKSDPRALRQFSSELWLKLSNTKPEWNDKLLQVTLHRWDDRTQKWDDAPIAISDRQVGGKQRIWQHTLTLLAAPDSRLAQEFRSGPSRPPNGKFLVKVHVDQSGRQLTDWNATMRDSDYVGQAEFRANWRPGYGGMTVVDAGTLKP